MVVDKPIPIIDAHYVWNWKCLKIKQFTTLCCLGWYTVIFPSSSIDFLFRAMIIMVYMQSTSIPRMFPVSDFEFTAAAAIYKPFFAPWFSATFDAKLAELPRKSLRRLDWKLIWRIYATFFKIFLTTRPHFVPRFIWLHFDTLMALPISLEWASMTSIFQ